MGMWGVQSVAMWCLVFMQSFQTPGNPLRGSTRPKSHFYGHFGPQIPIFWPFWATDWVPWVWKGCIRPRHHMANPGDPLSGSSKRPKNWDLGSKMAVKLTFWPFYITLWCLFKTTELSQYCVGISCLKLLTPGQRTEVWGDSEVNQGTRGLFLSTASATATTATTSGGPTNQMRRSWLLLQYIFQPDLIQCLKDFDFDFDWLIIYLSG